MPIYSGWLIVNRFLYTTKFSELYKWICDAAELYNVELSLYTNAELQFNIGGATDNCNNMFCRVAKPDFVLFYDKDLRLAQMLEKQGIRLFNCSKAIELCDDKSLMHLELAGQVPMPDTYCAPFTYENIGYTDTAFVDNMFKLLGAPLVVKEVFGSFGQQVYLCDSPDSVNALFQRIGGKRVLFQRFIKSSFGRDLRLNVVGDEVIAAMYRYNEHGDFRANISNGGSMKPHVPTEHESELAIKTAKLLNLDFCGVDLLFAEDESPLLCEVNSNAHFKSIYQCTGVNAAEAIIRHIVHTLDKNGAKA